jgi:hypothetical protein
VSYPEHIYQGGNFQRRPPSNRSIRRGRGTSFGRMGGHRVRWREVVPKLNSPSKVTRKKEPTQCWSISRSLLRIKKPPQSWSERHCHRRQGLPYFISFIIALWCLSGFPVNISLRSSNLVRGYVPICYCRIMIYKYCTRTKIADFQSKEPISIPN